MTESFIHLPWDTVLPADLFRTERIIVPPDIFDEVARKNGGLVTEQALREHLESREFSKGGSHATSE